MAGVRLVLPDACRSSACLQPRTAAWAGMLAHFFPPTVLPAPIPLQGAHLKALLMSLRLNDPKLTQHVVLRCVREGGHSCSVMRAGMALLRVPALPAHPPQLMACQALPKPPPHTHHHPWLQHAATPGGAAG